MLGWSLDWTQYLVTQLRVKRLRLFSCAQVDRQSKQPRVHLYKDKMTGELLGEATITYKDTATQRTALETYNNQMYQVI